MNQGFPPYQVQLLLLLTIVSVISGQDVSYKHTLTWWVFKRMKKNRRRFQTGETKAMAPYCSTLAWKIPWTEESSGLQSMGSRRVGHHWATSLSCIGEGNGSPLQCSCLENPRDGGAWWAAVYGVTQSRTRLTRLSSSSSRCVVAFWEKCVMTQVRNGMMNNT